MKKIIIALAACSISLGAFAWHGHAGIHHNGYHHWHNDYHWHNGYHHSWGRRGGCNFWPGFVGGVIGGVVGNAITTPVYRREVIVTPSPTTIVQNPVVVQNPTPVIVQQPTVIQNPSPIVVTNPNATQRVWIEGRYVNRTDQNGNVVRVWESGHWEYR